MLFVPAAALAIGEIESEDGDYTLEIYGAGRLTAAYLHYKDLPAYFDEEHDGLASGVMRLMAEGDLGEHLDYEVNSFIDITRSGAAGGQGAFATASSYRSPYRTRYLSFEYWELGAATSEVGLDRFALNLAAEPLSLSVGRFPLNYSVTSIFTPNDFFAPFSTMAINTAYKPGVDALRLGFTTGMLSSVELAGVMGYGDDDRPSWGQAALVTRVATVFGGFEWALLGGKLAERWMMGASIQGEAGPLNLRTEGHAGFPDPDGDGDLDGDVYGRVAAGLDVMFPWRNAALGAEYMYSSDGAGQTHDYFERAARFFPDDLFYLGQHYVGLTAGLDIIPILRLQLTGLLNAVDLSGLAALMMVYNLADEADLVVGVMAPWGESPSGPPMYPSSIESEYGLAPVTAFAECRFYF